MMYVYCRRWRLECSGIFFFFQAEDGIRDLVRSRGLGDVYKRQPLKEYLDQLTDKDLRILFPGAGRAYEAEYAHRLGFNNVFVIDLTDLPFADLLQRCPEFPKDHLLVGDLFDHEGAYDRILEQTFFCTLYPVVRKTYVQKMHELLKPGGILVGVLFDDVLNTDRPPFGGNRSIYEPIFTPYFPTVSMERCYNSVSYTHLRAHETVLDLV